MTTTLLITISPNGYIARKNDEAPWSPEEFTRCGEFAREVGNVIVGRKTFDIMKEAGDFDASIVTVVLTRTPRPPEGNVYFVNSPQEAVRLLSEKGFEKMLLSGGVGANTAFLDADLIDEMVFDVEPLLLGEGLPVFSERMKDVPLELLSVTSLDATSARLHYKVKR